MSTAPARHRCAAAVVAEYSEGPSAGSVLMRQAKCSVAIHDASTRSNAASISAGVLALDAWLEARTEPTADLSLPLIPEYLAAWTPDVPVLCYGPGT